VDNNKPTKNRRKKAPRNKMKTFMIVTAIVAIGFVFGRAMTHTAEFFLQAIKNNQRDRDND
jgi:hypothetical protein